MTRDVLNVLSIMQDKDFTIKLQGDTLTVLCSIFENPVTVNKDNQGAIALTVFPKMQPRTKHTMIKYHHFQIFVANGDVDIQHIDTK